VGESFEGQGEVVQRRGSLLVGAALFYALSWALALFRAPPWGVLIEQALATALLVVFGMNTYPLRRAGALRVDERGLHFAGEPLAARRDIASAYVLSERSALRIVRRRWQPSFDVEFEDEADARRLLDALGFGVLQSTVSFHAYWGSLRRMILVGAVISGGEYLALISRTLNWLPATVYAFAGLALLMRFRTRVEIGSDGLLLRRLGERTFVPYGALECASIEQYAIVLFLRSGKKIILGSGSSARDAQTRQALVQRIEEALMAYAQGGDSTGTEALVAPGGREIPVWVSETRALARARDYRKVRVDTERLWRVVNDASAQPATRAGAALALSSAPDGETRARLRVASEACADPRLRLALGRVADGAADDDLEEALAPLVAGDRR
jgi:hypothetical protein